MTTPPRGPRRTRARLAGEHAFRQLTRPVVVERRRIRGSDLPAERRGRRPPPIREFTYCDRCFDRGLEHFHHTATCPWRLK
jgi:hypothetical protein